MLTEYTLFGTLGIATYAIAANVAGKWWALLAVLFVLGSNTTPLLGPIAMFIAIGCFAQFLEKPSQWLLFGSGATLGIALATHPEGALLIPIYIALLGTHLVATIIRDWEETDPALRRNRFYVRVVHYLRGSLAIMGMGALTFYGLATLQTQGVNIATENFTLNWMAGNPILRPVSTQILMQNAERHAATALPGTTPTWSLITLAIIVGLLTLVRVIKKLRHAADELTLHYTEWILMVCIVVVALPHWNGLPNYAFATLLPLFAVLATESIKTWFTNEDPALHRNLSINIELTKNARFAIALKTTALIALIAWYLLDTSI